MIKPPFDVRSQSIAEIGPAAYTVEIIWVSHWRRPVRLLARPELIEAIASMPDRPPGSITWRGKRRKVKRADGPDLWRVVAA
ncbi:hypothetical protein ASG42_27120 [Rhizobium sp. Leaf391]|nr:hypothetical protein ASG42_27120 [Rhizobium sp. Leaf391]